MIRVGLDQNGTEALLKMLDELKATNKALTLTPSALASMAIQRYLERGQFKKDSKLLERKFFNEKKFLREAMKSGTDIKEAVQILSQSYKTKNGVTNSN